MSPNADPKPNFVYVPLYIVGGAFLGTGILNLYWSFGNDSTDLNGDFSIVGFNALDNIVQMNNFTFALPCIISGLALLVIANMNAWKETDGY
jgi:hypothetical protein